MTPKFFDLQDEGMPHLSFQTFFWMPLQIHSHTYLIHHQNWGFFFSIFIFNFSSFFFLEFFGIFKENYCKNRRFLFFFKAFSFVFPCSFFFYFIVLYFSLRFSVLTFFTFLAIFLKKSKTQFFLFSPNLSRGCCCFFFLLLLLVILTINKTASKKLFSFGCFLMGFGNIVGKNTKGYIKTVRKSMFIPNCSKPLEKTPFFGST